VLQIVTKRYFRDGVPLHSTVHREVLYTNCGSLRGDIVELPVGELAPSTTMQPVSSVTLSVTEHLEAQELDGEPSMLVATGGTELVDALADVLSFGLNAVFSRDKDLVKGLVPNSLDGSSRSLASKLFRRTFEPHRFVPEAEFEELRRFMTQLLALRRDHFEAAMRAIRRVVYATHRAVDDPTLAYVDFVAALESLSKGTSVPAPTWDRVDGRKRKLIDGALEGADVGSAERVREAVMEAERFGAKSGFVAFVMNNVSPEYYRTEAADAVRPVCGADLERIVKLAYDIRSYNVHGLKSLPAEAWVLGDGADTVSPADTGTMLSHEGLARLARHVVKSYVDRAPVGIDPSFDWRASLPGQMRLRPAPEYWIWKAEQFDHRSADRYLSGFVIQLVSTRSGPDRSVPDMSAVLRRIEQLLPGTAAGPAKTFMVAIYVLWHRVTATNLHQPNSERILGKYEHLLQQAGVPSFVVGLLSGRIPDWTEADWHKLATERRAERSKRRHLELPASFDAALQLMAAERLMAAGRTDEARVLAGSAVEELPGNEPLMAWEDNLVAGESYELDLNALLLGVQPDAGAGEETPAANGGGSSDGAADPEDGERTSAAQDASSDAKTPE
jgi:hypothetical protein